MPYCKQLATKRHSTYISTLQDLPIQDKKVILIIHNKKMFCENKNCTKKTFAEYFDFYNPKAKKN
ncbi:MAG: transposase family protein [Clostridium sp.]